MDLYNDRKVLSGYVLLYMTILAIAGLWEGVITSFYYKIQLENFVNIILYVVYTINFFIIAGFILGILFSLFFRYVKHGKVLDIVFGTTVFCILFGYGLFWCNFFRIIIRVPVRANFFKPYNLVDEFVVLPLTIVLAFILTRYLRRIRMAFTTILIILSVSIVINTGIFIMIRPVESAKAISKDSESLTRLDSSLSPFSLPEDFNRPQNCVFILIDTLRADHLGCYGYYRNTSPNIDRLAGDGVLFSYCIAQKACTSPSVASIFTGHYPNIHGIHTNATRLPGNLTTIAELFRNNNFLTYAVSANANISKEFNFNQGFKDIILTDNKGVTLEGIQFLRDTAGGNFFLYLHYIDPHGPYKPPPEFDVFDPDPVYSKVVDPKYIESTTLLPGPNNVNFYLSKYDGEILYTDNLVGQVVDLLGELGLREETLILVTADHGEDMGEHYHYYFRHGHLSYDPGVRVPLVLNYSGLPSGINIDTIIESIDIMPTVLNLMGLNTPHNIDGVDFTRIVFEDTDLNTIAYSQTGTGIWGDDVYAMRSHTWRLIYNSWIPKKEILFSPWFFFNPYKRYMSFLLSKYLDQREIYELYDLVSDPEEKNNIYRPHHKVAQRLQDELTSYINLPRRRIQKSIDEDKIDRKVLKRLKSLGYIH